MMVVIASLAVYRVSYLIANEDGPFELAEKLRTWIYMQWTANKQKQQGNGWNHWTYRGINCPLCISFWLAWLAAWPISNNNLDYVYMSLGIAGAVLVMHRGTNGERR